MSDTEKEAASATLFLDTNTLLHYKPIDQADWRRVARTANVDLVVTLPVVDELDKHKSDPRLKERAQRAIKDIVSVVAGNGRVRDGVTLRLLETELRRGTFPSELDFDRLDHRIIYLAQQEVGTGRTVAIVTADTGLKLRAERRGLRVFEPLESDKLPDVENEDKKKIRQLTADLQAERSRRPRLSVLVGRPGTRPAAPICEFALPVAVQLYETESLVRREDESLPVPSRQAREARLMLAGAFMDTAPPEEVDRYLTERRKYLDRLEGYYTAMNMWAKLESRMFLFDLEVVNDGSSPALDVLVELTFSPAVRFLLKSGDRPPMDRPSKPQRPELPRTELQLRRAAFDGVTPSSRVPIPTPDFERFITRRDPGEPKVEVTEAKDGGFVLRLGIPSLIHLRRNHFPGFRAYFGEEAIKPMPVAYRITSASLPQAAEGEVVFKASRTP